MPQRKRLTIDQFLQQPPAPRRPSIDEFLKTPTVQQPPPSPPQTPDALAPPGFDTLRRLSNLQTGISRGVLEYGVNPALSLAEAVGSAATGNFTPLGQMAERAGRGVGRLAIGGAPGFAQSRQANEQAITEIAAEQAKRQQFQPGFEQARLMGSGLEQFESQDPSLSGRITRGVGQVIGAAAPALLTRSIPGGAGMAALQSAAQPETAALNVGAAVGLPVAAQTVGQFLRPILSRVRGAVKAAERIEAAAAKAAPTVKEAPPVVAPAAPTAPTAPPAPADALQSAFAKLGTNNADEIGEMIANANRRYNKEITVPGSKARPITKDERLSYWDDFNRIIRLTPDEETALAQVLPERTYSPVGIFEEKGKVGSRAISDFPAEQQNAQLIANQRELENFFTGQRRALQQAEDAAVMGDIGPGGYSGQTALPAPQIAGRMAATARTPTSPVSLPEIRAQFPGLSKQQFDDEVLRLAEQGQINLMRHDAPGLLSEAERNAMVKVGNDYYTAATVTGPRAEAAAFEVAPPATGAAPTGTPPPELTGNLWEITPEQQALFAGAPSAPREAMSSGRAIAAVFRTAAQANRTIRTVFDFSAPLNQGAVLSRAHPILAAGAGKQMIRSLWKSKSANIDNAILNDPATALGRQFDLHIATGGAPEEAFLLKQLNRAPIVGWSERTYRTYLDTLRLSVWKSYVKSLQSMGYFPENAAKAYRQAAQFINIATGRGSLKAGGRLDKAMALGGDILFAPRNLAAKFQLLDPVRYMQLAPGARKLVLRDAITSFGSILGTATLLSAAGVKVGMKITDDDFLTAHWGNHRYDLTGGLKTEVRFLARMIRGAYNKATGEGNLPSDEPLNVASNYVRQKVTPLLGTIYSAFKGTDPKGEKMSDKSASEIALGFGPMFFEDLYEGAKDSGVAGALKSAPAFIGQRVSAYPERAKAAFIATPDQLRSEQKQAGENRWFLQPHKAKDKTETDETPAQFAARLDKANTWVQEYGQQLVASQDYQEATADQRRAARAHLKRVITELSDEDRPHVRRLSPRAIIHSVRVSERRNTAEKRKSGQ